MNETLTLALLVSAITIPTGILWVCCGWISASTYLAVGVALFPE